MKKFLSILCFSCLLSGSLISCTNDDNIEDSTVSNELPAPKGALQEIFYKLSNNNFSLSYTDRYAALGVTRTQETRYTSYSLESNGDLGFNGYAQNDECVFSYNIVDNEIVSGVPVIDYNNGILITDIYNYRDGLQNFDYTFLPSDYKSGEEYIYEFGKNELNDELLVSVFLRKTYNPAAKPKEIKMKVVAGNLVVDCINNYYEIQDDYDTCQVVTFDIGTTENSLIKKYLDSWDFERINKVDIAVLRISIYSLLYQQDIHPTIIINEAIDIAKEFGSGDSFRFVNAVLDNIRKELNR